MTSGKTSRKKGASAARNPYSRRKKNHLFNHVRRLLAVLILFFAANILGPELLPELPPQAREAVSVLEELLSADDSSHAESPDSSQTGTAADSRLNSPANSLTASQADSRPPQLTDSGNIRVDFLDVGQGLSVLVEADGACLLYDGGDRGASSFVVAYLKERGVDTLDYVIASHYDADHINGLVGALNTCEVKKVFGPDYSTDTRVYHSLVSKADELGIGITSPEPGSRYPLGQGYFEVLGPLSDDYSDVNNYSLVIRLVYGETSFLLTGDAEEDSEMEMLQAWPDLKSNVLCVGHHGSPSSSSEAFLNKVQPDYAVISCGKDNSYGHPDEAVLKRLEKLQVPIWRTDEAGTITARGDGKSLLFSTEKAQ